VGELLQHLEDTLSHAACTSHSENHGPVLLRGAGLGNVSCDTLQGQLHGLVILIHIGTAQEDKGCLEFLLQHELSDASEEIKGSGNPGIATESHQSVRHIALLLWLFPNAFIIDHADVLL